MRAVVAQSKAVDTTVAAGELLSQATEALAGAAPKAALMFASTDYDHAILLAAIQDRWPGLPLIGGSTDGEVSSVSGFEHDSALLTLLVGDEITARTGLGRDLSKNLDAAVAATAPALARTKSTRRLCFTVFAPSANSCEVVRQLQERLGHDCPVLGGLTGDHREYSRMVEFCGGEVLRDSLPVMIIDGIKEVSWGIGTGWFPIGEPLVVTKSDGNIVHTIGNRPAFDVFRDYWGAVPEDSLGEYPLAVYPNGPNGHYFLRAVLSADHATGSIRLAGAVPQGAMIRLTEVLPEGILSGSEAAASAAVRAYRGKQPELALVISCAARKWVLGTQAEKEWEYLQRALRSGGCSPALAGFYAFGEIAPNAARRPSEFHNETCITVLLGQ